MALKPLLLLQGFVKLVITEATAVLLQFGFPDAFAAKQLRADLEHQHGVIELFCQLV
jgi:hypothetical protein